MIGAARRTRVLVVDDSAVVRSLLRSVVASDPQLEVAGTAADGAAALESITTLAPDLMLLDVEMPVMDGLTTLKRLRASGHRLPVIMCSALTQRGARVTIEALASGAADYVTKPTAQENRESAVRSIAAQLLPKIHAMVRRTQTPTLPFAPAAVSPRSPRQTAIPPAIVAIGVSTGGPEALETLLAALPGYFRLPVVVVQHMPALFTTMLAERLDRSCLLRVREAREGMPVEPGHIFIARGDLHLEVRKPAARAGTGTLHLTSAPPENHCRPAVDVLFRSLAAVYGGRVLAVMLTGMGHDGLASCRILRNGGATILAQDEATSVVWGMPGAVVSAGLADRVLPLSEMALEIVRLTSSRLNEASALPGGGGLRVSTTHAAVDLSLLRRIVEAHSHNVLDPSRDYVFEARLAGIVRRLGMSNLSDLVEHLRINRDPHLESAVADAMTINETSFFRDARPFELLRADLLPKLIEARRAVRSIRMWSAACSTGQEPYSLAILMREHFPSLANWQIRIEATDISERVLRRAQAGRFERIEVNRGLPARYLVGYFDQEQDQWVVKPHVRSLCSFQKANLGRVPLPFRGKFDVIFLRNVMLYFAPDTRRALLTEVHRLLASDGVLFLGSTEQPADPSLWWALVAGGTCYFRPRTAL